MNEQIKNIIFDFGGVIVDLDFHATVDAFRQMGADTQGVVGQYVQQGLFRELELGQVSPQEFCARLMPHEQPERICQAWCRMLQGIPARRLRELRRLAEHYNISLLSNTNDIHWDYSLQQFFLPQGFDPEEHFQHLFMSQRMGMAKPGEAIFRRVLDESGYRPEETLYIDDSPVNCAAFARLGVHTFCPQRPDDWMPTVATIGFFDGVHRGHQCLIDQVRQQAAARGLSSMVLTLDQHPRQVLQADYQPQLLSTLPEKTDLLTHTGIDVCRVLHFDADMCQLTAPQFMQQVLRRQLNVQVLVMGYDHRFGHGGGTMEQYVRWGREAGIEVLQAQPLQDEYASSSQCRRLLAEGRIAEATHLLGHPYQLGGQVVAGHGVGHQLGFPTANVQPDAGKLIPARGAYAVRVTLADGSQHPGMLNIGTRPTLDNGTDQSIEVHLMDYEGDLYGQRLCMQFVAFLRPEQCFATRQQLISQLQHDRQQALAALAGS